VCGERGTGLVNILVGRDEAGRGGDRERDYCLFARRILGLTFIVTISIMGVIEALEWLCKWVLA